MLSQSPTHQAAKGGGLVTHVGKHKMENSGSSLCKQVESQTCSCDVLMLVAHEQKPREAKWVACTKKKRWRKPKKRQTYHKYSGHTCGLMEEKRRKKHTLNKPKLPGLALLVGIAENWPKIERRKGSRNQKKEKEKQMGDRGDIRLSLKALWSK